MRLLLPPSETKRDGGNAGRPLDLELLSFPGLASARCTVLEGLCAIADDSTAMAAALRVPARRTREFERNRELRRSPTLPALHRYTGVLYDALDAATLDPDARVAAGHSVVVHSALFGLLGADDPIPSYRFSHDSRLPAVRLPAIWRTAVTAELDALDGLVLDLRSGAYAALGPLPYGPDRWTVRVTMPGASAFVSSHAGKRVKGEFVRELLSAAPGIGGVDALLAWAADRRVGLRRGAAGELLLDARA